MDQPHALPESAQELARLAYEFAAAHPTHPMAGILRARSAALLGIPPTATPLELSLLLSHAQRILSGAA